MEGHSCWRATRDMGMPKGPGLGGVGPRRCRRSQGSLGSSVPLGRAQASGQLPTPHQGQPPPMPRALAMDVLAGGEGYGFHRAQEPLPLWLHRTRSWIGAVP